MASNALVLVRICKAISRYLRERPAMNVNKRVGSSKSKSTRKRVLAFMSYLLKIRGKERDEG
jgi:hypothetical protein